MSNITPEYLTKIAPRLRAARESAGLSIDQAAKKTIVTPTKISGYENGIVPPEHVDFREIYSLLDAYHVSVNELEADPMSPISDTDMFMKVKAGLVSDEQFGRWIKIDRQLAKSPQEDK